MRIVPILLAGIASIAVPAIAQRTAHSAAVSMNQSGLRYFDYHHTPEDTLDRIDPQQLRQNVAAWTAMLWIVANAPEELGPVTPGKGE